MKKTKSGKKLKAASKKLLKSLNETKNTLEEIVSYELNKAKPKMKKAAEEALYQAGFGLGLMQKTLKEISKHPVLTKGIKAGRSKSPASSKGSSDPAPTPQKKTASRKRASKKSTAPTAKRATRKTAVRRRKKQTLS